VNRAEAAHPASARAGGYRAREWSYSPIPRGTPGKHHGRMTVHSPKDSILPDPAKPSVWDEGSRGYGSDAALMTAASLNDLRDELERLRRHTRLEIAQRLRDARSYGGGSNNDDYHAVREEQMVLEARIASLEDTLARAIVVDSDDAARGVAAIGSTALIEDLASGAMSQYRLASAHHSVGPDTISAASPMERALVGAKPGTTLTVELANGRTRSIRLVDVKGEDTATPASPAAA
jgi:transcription elongation factor GreA